MVGRIVAIDVRPPELGVRVPMAGMQDIVAPKIFARIADEGCSKDIAFMITHPAVNFTQNYLIEPLQQRGCAAMGLNTRGDKTRRPFRPRSREREYIRATLASTWHKCIKQAPGVPPENYARLANGVGA